MTKGGSEGGKEREGKRVWVRKERKEKVEVKQKCYE